MTIFLYDTMQDMKIPRQSFDEARERREQRGDEWQLGAAITSLFSVPLSERRKYQPIGEVQRGAEDTQDCASRDKVNDCEAQMNFAYRNGLLHPDTRRFFDENGYVVIKNGIPYIECSDAYIGIKSGTTRTGNSLKAPAHAVYQWGLVPKSLLPLEEWMTWDDYHSPSRITKEIEDLGLECKMRLPINYEQVQRDEFESTIKHSEICTAGYAWPFPNENGVYPRSPNNFNHAFKLMEPAWYAQDNYLDSHDNDYIKHLAEDYRFFDWGYQMCFTGQYTDIDVLKKMGIFDKLMEVLKALRAYLAKIGKAIRGV